jgi:hypothetical protein
MPHSEEIIDHEKTNSLLLILIGLNLLPLTRLRTSLLKAKIHIQRSQRFFAEKAEY